MIVISLSWAGYDLTHIGLSWSSLLSLPMGIILLLLIGGAIVQGLASRGARPVHHPLALDTGAATCSNFVLGSHRRSQDGIWGHT